MLDLLVPTRGSERGWVAPRVVVESVEVTSLIVGTAVHVLCHVITVALDISGGVANRDGTVASAANVLLHVTSDSLDVGSTIGVVVGIDDFISREEKKRVVVFGKRINRSEDRLQVCWVVRCRWLIAVDRVLWCVHIQGEVDASICQRAHACVVVRSVVYSVDTDSVDTQLLEPVITCQ